MSGEIPVAGGLPSQTPTISVGDLSVRAGETDEKVKVGTHFFRQAYLYAFAPQGEVSNHVRTQSIKDDVSRLPEILQQWDRLQPRVQALLAAEVGIAATISVAEVAPEFRPMLNEYARDPLFAKTFAATPISIRVVEIDKLVAGQRTVNLDYVDKLTTSYGERRGMKDLLEVCVAPRRTMEPVQHLEVAQNVHAFSSPNSDLRFLGAFAKETLDDADVALAEMGGLPVAAVVAFVGYGVGSVNAFLLPDRVILNNGFHRVFALRRMGVTEIPIVLQHIGNPQLELPPVIAGLPKEYLVGAGRPVLMKDFFEDDFTIELRVRDRIRIVTMGIGPNQHDIPA